MYRFGGHGDASPQLEQRDVEFARRADRLGTSVLPDGGEVQARTQGDDLPGVVDREAIASPAGEAAQVRRQLEGEEDDEGGGRRVRPESDAREGLPPDADRRGNLRERRGPLAARGRGQVPEAASPDGVLQPRGARLRSEGLRVAVGELEEEDRGVAGVQGARRGRRRRRRPAVRVFGYRTGQF